MAVDPHLQTRMPDLSMPKQYVQGLFFSRQLRINRGASVMRQQAAVLGGDQELHARQQECRHDLAVPDIVQHKQAVFVTAFAAAGQVLSPGSAPQLSLWAPCQRMTGRS